MVIDIDNIYPLIVPSGYYSKGTWELPHYVLRSTNYILTWVTFGSGATMSYLTQGQQQYLDAKYCNWQQNSFENLRHSICDDECFFTEYKLSEDEKRLIFISFLNYDRIGSSRILLSNELTKAFPNDYYLAFPDRSCGLAIAKDITEKELADTKDLVRNLHRIASTAMSAQLHDPSDFSLPKNWTDPIDTEFSQDLTIEIIKYKPI
jgi:hypothetical protein